MKIYNFENILYELHIRILFYWLLIDLSPRQTPVENAAASTACMKTAPIDLFLLLGNTRTPAGRIDSVPDEQVLLPCYNTSWKSQGKVRFQEGVLGSFWCLFPIQRRYFCIFDYKRDRDSWCSRVELLLNRTCVKVFSPEIRLPLNNNIFARFFPIGKYYNAVSWKWSGGTWKMEEKFQFLG